MKIKGEDLKQIKNFQQEKDKFYLLSVIALSSSPLMYSDLENYIIGRSETRYPTWIWTKDNLSEEKTDEITKILDKYLISGANKFTCKKELYDKLSKKYSTKDYFEMGYLTCKEVVKPSQRKGIFVRPNYADKVTLAEFIRNNTKEIENKEISQQEALEQAEQFISGKEFYVLKNNKGDLVSMAGYSVIDGSAKISHVYTAKEERGKSYCKNLIYELTKKLLNEGYKVLLYTDYHYQPSNVAYKKVGFEDEGILINFTIIEE